jgi:flagellar M-ring protein FliF|uniref:Flagellar M-ring protein n=1 Tax=Leptospirillum ferriphilum TaxID=178606 RepID=A0A7C3LT79_9BACT
MDGFRQVFQNFMDRFSQMPAARRMTILVLFAGIVAGGIFFSMMEKNGGDGILFSNLSPGDSMAIQGRLNRLGVPYSLQKKGSVIRVPSGQVYALRMELADEGLPRHHGAGFDLFNHPSLATTDFVQRVQYLEALQTELDRTIEEMTPIALARVSIVLPRRTVFLREPDLSHASVLVRLKPGMTLERPQVNGIVHLVANAVPGLSAKRVTVVDTEGQILNRKRRGLVPGELTEAQLSYQREVQHSFQHQLQSMLDKVLGPDQSVVRVSAELNFRQVEKTSRTWDPNGRVLKDREQIREKSVGSHILPVGVPGVLSNIPGPNGKVASPPLGPNNTSETRYSKKKQIAHYHVSRTDQHVTEPVGDLRRISVSVLVNAVPVTINGKSGPKTVLQPRSPQEIRDFTRIVQNAIGYDPKRGDQVVVLSVPFSGAAVPVQKNIDQTFQEKIAPFVPLLEIFLGGLLMVIFSLLVLRPLLKAMVQWKPEAPAMQVAQGPSVGGGTEEEPVRSSREEVARMTQEDPSQAATVVRSWLKEK